MSSSDDKHTTIINKYSWTHGLANVIWALMWAFLLIGSCGEPDLIDATVDWVQRQP